MQKILRRDERMLLTTVTIIFKDEATCRKLQVLNGDVVARGDKEITLILRQNDAIMVGNAIFGWYDKEGICQSLASLKVRLSI